MEKIALFPGSFDPFTLGHLAVAERGLTIFDRIVIGVGVNTDKREGLLAPEQRKALIERVFKLREEAVDAAEMAEKTAAKCETEAPVSTAKCAANTPKIAEKNGAKIPQTTPKNTIKNRVEVVVYDELTGDFCRKNGIRHILRGIRNSADFEYEHSMEMAGTLIYPEITTIAIFTPAEYIPVSSRLVREIITMGGDPAPFLPKGIDIRNYL